MKTKLKAAARKQHSDNASGRKKARRICKKAISGPWVQMVLGLKVLEPSPLVSPLITAHCTPGRSPPYWPRQQRRTYKSPRACPWPAGCSSLGSGPGTSSAPGAGQVCSSGCWRRVSADRGSAPDGLRAAGVTRANAQKAPDHVPDVYFFHSFSPPLIRANKGCAYLMEVLISSL